mmetsp:Transcript_123029/g.353475  ORF Transcript_123029/g.353475 Transcript_123029/m.353475 type:complete len:245 (+) Transcript_123029:179-913(+)
MDATFIGRNHVLDVDVCILPAVCFQDLECLGNQVAHADALALSIVHTIAEICVVRLVHVEHRQNLAVVWDQGLADHVAGLDQLLNELDRRAHDDLVASGQRLFNRDDQLRHHRQDLRAALLKEVVGALHGQEAVRILLFPSPIEEHGQVVVVIELVDVHLPRDLAAATTVEHRNRQVAAVVKLPELRRLHRPREGRAGTRRRRRLAARHAAQAHEGCVHRAQARRRKGPPDPRLFLHRGPSLRR